jgi:hypothetical protein
MNEHLLQYIWKHRYFDKSSLATINGESLSILHPGQHNHNQGPDFLEARIKMNQTTWVGNVELHIRTSDWDLHGHTGDKNYENIILHVVWEHDVDSLQRIPVLQLRDRVSKLLLDRYLLWMNNRQFIPCEKEIAQVDELVFSAWKDRLTAERLQRKSKKIAFSLKETREHWEEMFWRMIARNFGATVNSDAFERVSISLPLSILTKHKNQVNQLEALLLGQAGLLNDQFNEDYPKMLQREYNFLRTKYGLVQNNLPVHFLRMRPGNFPTIRLAQLAMLIHDSAHLFSKTLEFSELSDLRELFTVKANDYWHYHYCFGELSAFKPKIVGKAMVESIIINTVIPVVYRYGVHVGEKKYKEKALRWLEEIPPELNNITSEFENLGIKNKNAFDTQALLELKKEYCDNRRCLECAIGNNLLKRNM